MLCFTKVVILQAVGAGAAGSIMTRYEGLAYNIPAVRILFTKINEYISKQKKNINKNKTRGHP